MPSNQGTFPISRHEEYTAAANPWKLKRAVMHGQKPFILIVEDDAPLRKVLTLFLRAKGYVVLEAASFREAVDKIAIKPDLMVLDIFLPDATGWDVINWLRSFTQDVPIVLMSAVTRPSPQQLEKAGTKAFLAKPFPIEELMRLVGEYAPMPKNLASEVYEAG